MILSMESGRRNGMPNIQTPKPIDSLQSSTQDSPAETARKKSRILLTLQSLLARGIAEKNPSLIQAVHRSSLKYLGPILTLQLMQEGLPQPPIPMSLDQTQIPGSIPVTPPSTIPLDQG